jgi:hypothetical protein
MPRAQQGHPARALGGRLEQRGFPDPRLAHKRERRALTGPRPLQNRVDRMQLPIPAKQHRRED